MAMKPSIVAFAGSARKDSFNKRLVRVAADGARGAGAAVTVIDLAEMPMPIFDEDLEAADGLPDGAKRFRELLLSHDGFLIASPEYNSSISPLLKNAIDWASRKQGDEAPLACFRGKVVGLMAASPGGLGGLRGLVHVRAILGNIGSLVIPEQHAVSKAHEAFDDDGQLNDEAAQKAVQAIGARVTEVVARLRG